MTVAFELVDDPETSLLAWTTTPWTLPSNLALCVNPEFTYVKIHDLTRDRCFILLEELIGTLFPELSNKKQDPKKPKYKVVGKFKGEDMKGWRYTPLFDYFTEQVRPSTPLPSYPSLTPARCPPAAAVRRQGVPRRL